jgi:hypothetical protein
VQASLWDKVVFIANTGNMDLTLARMCCTSFRTTFKLLLIEMHVDIMVVMVSGVFTRCLRGSFAAWKNKHYEFDQHH